MNDNPTVALNLTLNDIQILNDIISNSSPTAKFSVVADFVGRINKQLQDALRAVQEQVEPKEEAHAKIATIQNP